MLRTLRIRNLVIVEDLTIDFTAGLNLLTGETGAGKSILVDALGLVCGVRADRSAVRSGQRRAVVDALFDVADDSPLHRWMGDRGLAGPEEGQLVVQREVAASGSGRALVNGSPCTLSTLRELGERLLELHGQHEQQTLLRPERHLELLDGYGDHDRELAAVADSFAAVCGARGHLAELQQRAARRSERAAELEQILAEISGLDPRPGELAELARERRLLQSAGRVAELLEQIVDLTYEGDATASGLAAAAAARAEELASIDGSLEELAARCRAAAVELQDLGAGFRDYRERADFDPARLEQIENRSAALERLCLRYGTDEAGLAGLRGEADAELETLGQVGKSLETAAAELAREEQCYARACGRLGSARDGAAKRLGGSVEAQLGELALPKARFRVELVPIRAETVRVDGTEVPLGRRGAERAELRLAANPGEPFRPLQQAASGGELARVMLALHVVADRDGPGRPVVFDEVDAGVSGAVADAVGARLARLARRRQVLCVTHLPQVAAHADAHYRVVKRVAAGRTSTAVARLDREGRVAELARMLGGRRATTTSREHAASLLRSAGRGRPTSRVADP